MAEVGRGSYAVAPFNEVVETAEAQVVMTEGDVGGDVIHDLEGAGGGGAVLILQEGGEKEVHKGVVGGEGAGAAFVEPMRENSVEMVVETLFCVFQSCIDWVGGVVDSFGSGGEAAVCFGEIGTGCFLCGGEGAREGSVGGRVVDGAVLIVKVGPRCVVVGDGILVASVSSNDGEGTAEREKGVGEGGEGEKGDDCEGRNDASES